MQHKLALLFIRRPVIEGDLEVTARENSNALRSMVPAQLDSIGVLSFNDDLAAELHLKLFDLLSVNHFAFTVLANDRRRDLHEPRHAADVRILDVVHDTEEAFELVDFSSCLHIAWVVALAQDLDILANQGYPVELNSRHHFL